MPNNKKYPSLIIIASLALGSLLAAVIYICDTIIVIVK